MPAGSDRSLWSAFGDGFVGEAKETWEGVKATGAYIGDFATDGAVREQAWSSTVSAAESARDYAGATAGDPAKPFRDLGKLASETYGKAADFVRTASSDELAEALGSGAFTAGSFLAGGGAAAGSTKLAAKAGTVAKAASASKAVAKAASAVEKAKKAGKLADDVPGACAKCKGRVAPIRKAYHREDLADEWYDAEKGDVRWPDNEGFDGPSNPEALAKGTRIDRYSLRTGTMDEGEFFSPEGASFEARALPFEESMVKQTVYEVVEPFEVQAGKTASWFDQPGGAMQYKTDQSVADLLRAGKIRQIK